MKSTVSENLVAHIWQSNRVTRFVADSGENVQVIHPGRFSHGVGGDFQDAVLLINGQKVHGSIEIHVTNKQWYSHRHHHDSRYNSTVLHVVYRRDSPAPTTLQNGRAIPTISLSPATRQYLDILNEQPNARLQGSPPCPHITRLSAEHLTELLTAAGKQFFVDKAGSFLSALTRKKPDQVLFEGLARALGYSQNSEAFLSLANKMTLDSILQLQPPKEKRQQALILGAAGLLPCQRARSKQKPVANSEAEELEEHWRTLGLPNVMSETDWCFFRVRPDNFPTRRLIALSCLISKYHKHGLLQGILKLITEPTEEIAYRRLIDRLTTPAQGYWANHYDFGAACPRSAALIGHDKAMWMAVNIVLPFASAWSRISQDPKLEYKAVKTYHRLPKPADNELTHYMRQQLLIAPCARLTACSQQGLLHIFKNYCRFRDCAACPISAN
ncbi:MAG: DUF2851 family protein [Chloroflexi bacterium]|nr:DUF2851 family protein [Chloroflexota bacterium]